LTDKSAEVRLRAAQGLLGTGDFAGIPTLIDLLQDNSKAIVWQAEELLTWVAGDDAPQPFWGMRFQAFWRDWWAGVEKAGGVDFKVLAAEPRRPTLFLTPTGTLFGCDGRNRWVLPLDRSLNYHSPIRNPPVLVTQILPSGNILGIASVRIPNSPSANDFAFESEPNGKWLWSTDLLNTMGPSMAGDCRRWPMGITTFAAHWNLGTRNMQGETRLISKNSTDSTLKNAGLRSGNFLKTDGFATWYYGYELGNSKPGQIEIKMAVSFDPSTGRQLNTDLKNMPAPEKLIVGSSQFLVDGKYRRVIERDSSGRLVWDCLGIPYGILSEMQVLSFGKLHDEYPQLKIVFPQLRMGFDDLPIQRIDLRASLKHRIEQLQDPNPWRRRAAAETLMEDFGEKALQAIPYLLSNYATYLARKTEYEKNWHCYDPSVAIKAICGKRCPAIVREYLNDERPLVRAGALLMMGNKTGNTTAFTTEERFAAAHRAIKDRSPDVRRAAAEAMLSGQITNQDEICDILCNSLTDNQLPLMGGVSTDVEAADSLTGFLSWAGDKLKPETIVKLIKAFKEASSNSNSELARLSLIAMGRIGSLEGKYADAVLPALITALTNDKRPKVRGGAAWGLGYLGKNGQPAVLALTNVLIEPLSEDLFECVLNGIGGIGPDAAEAAPNLTLMLKEAKTSHNQLMLIIALGRIGPKAKEAIPIIKQIRIEAVEARDSSLTGVIDRALKEIEKQ
jgi:HEAT repeat protein